MKIKLVKVKWQDTMSESDWKDIDEIKKWAKKERAICVSVGWLVERTKKYIVVAGSKGVNDEDYGDFIRIPRAIIKKITRL